MRWLRSFLLISMLAALSLVATAARQATPVVDQTPAATEVVTDPTPTEQEFSAAEFVTYFIGLNYQTVPVTGGSIPVSVTTASFNGTNSLTSNLVVPSGWSFVANSANIISGSPDCSFVMTNVAQYSATQPGSARCEFNYTVTIPAGTASGTYLVQTVPSNIVGEGDFDVHTAVISVLVDANVDLALNVATPLPPVVDPGTPYTAVFSLSNSGPHPSVNAHVGFALTGLTGFSATCTKDGLSCSGATMTTRPDGLDFTIGQVIVGGSPLLFSVTGTTGTPPPGNVSIAGSANSTASQESDTSLTNNGATTSAVLQLPEATSTTVPTTTPTETSVPTSTPTETPIPTSTPTETPVATSTPTEPPVPTSTPTEPPVPTSTPTETPVSTSTPTEPPVPTSTPTEPPVPTSTPTEPPVPTSTPTLAPTETPIPTGSLMLTITTADGNEVPTGAEVCLDSICHFADEIVASSIPSGSVVRFEDIDPGTYQLTIQNASPYLDFVGSVTIVGFAETTASVVLQLPEPTSTSVPGETPIATIEPTSTVPPTPPTVAATEPAGPTSTPSGITTLPSTGQGAHSQPISQAFAIVVLGLVGSMLIGAAGLGRHRRGRR